MRGTSIWLGPNCELSVLVEGNRFLASGQYEIANNPLLPSLLGAERKVTKYSIKYEGKLVGSRVEGTVERKTDGATQSAGLLGLGTMDAKIGFLMVVGERDGLIYVMEDPTSPRFYELDSRQESQRS